VGMLRETYCEQLAQYGTMCAVHATGVEWPECCDDQELAMTLLRLSCDPSARTANEIAKVVDVFMSMRAIKL